MESRVTLPGFLHPSFQLAASFLDLGSGMGQTDNGHQCIMSSPYGVGRNNIGMRLKSMVWYSRA